MPKPKQSPRNQQVAGKHGGRRQNAGGKRSGAGRPRKETAQAAADLRAQTVETIGRWLPDLLKNLKEAADKGDREANIYLINRLIGKPTERVETNDGGGVTVTVLRPDGARAETPNG